MATKTSTRSRIETRPRDAGVQEGTTARGWQARREVWPHSNSREVLLCHSKPTPMSEPHLLWFPFDLAQEFKQVSFPCERLRRRILQNLYFRLICTSKTQHRQWKREEKKIRMNERMNEWITPLQKDTKQMAHLVNSLKRQVLQKKIVKCLLPLAPLDWTFWSANYPGISPN